MVECSMFSTSVQTTVASSPGITSIPCFQTTSASPFELGYTVQFDLIIQMRQNLSFINCGLLLV